MVKPPACGEGSFEDEKTGYTRKIVETIRIPIPIPIPNSEYRIPIPNSEFRIPNSEFPIPPPLLSNAALGSYFYSFSSFLRIFARRAMIIRNEGKA